MMFKTWKIADYILVALIAGLLITYFLVQKMPRSPVATEVVRPVNQESDTVDIGWFDTLFDRPAKMKLYGLFYELKPVKTKPLSITTGKLIVCSPENLFAQKPLFEKFPAGEFPVEYVLAWRENYTRVALTRIKFSAEPVVRWANAITGVDAHDTIAQLGFPVDAGTATILDSAASSLIREMDDPEAKFSSEFFFNPKQWEDYRVYLEKSIGKYGISLFAIGTGDGVYSCYIGYDKNNKPVRLVVDGLLITWK